MLDTVQLQWQVFGDLWIIVKAGSLLPVRWVERVERDTPHVFCVGGSSHRVVTLVTWEPLP